MKPKTLDQLKQFCAGCRHDRYNHKGLCERPGIDAPVTSDYCWHLSFDKLEYNRTTHTFQLTCHT